MAAKKKGSIKKSTTTKKSTKDATKKRKPSSDKEKDATKLTRKEKRAKREENERKRIELKNKALSATGDGILGYWAYWDCESVCVSRRKFLEILKKVNVEGWEQYAHEIGPSTAFHRALDQLVKEETLTLVEEDPVKILYQIDERELSDDKYDETVDSKVSFKYKSRVAIAKDPLRKGKIPEEFVVSDDQKLRKDVIKLFKETSETYTTTEFRKFVKRTFNNEADLIRMRKAGGVYFVPYCGKEIGEKMMNLFELVPGNSVFDFVPMPEGTNSRRALRRALVSEAESLMEDLNRKVSKLDGESSRIESTVSNRLKEVLKIRTKVEAYASYMEDKSKDLLSSLSDVEKQIRKFVTG